MIVNNIYNYDCKQRLRKKFEANNKCFRETVDINSLITQRAHKLTKANKGNMTLSLLWRGLHLHPIFHTLHNIKTPQTKISQTSLVKKKKKERASDAIHILCHPTATFSLKKNKPNPTTATFVSWETKGAFFGIEEEKKKKK